MRNSGKKTPTSVGKKANQQQQSNQQQDTSGGKKLVQARLPFKILSSPVVGDVAAVDSTPQQANKKRKLSYNETEDDVNPTKILCKSDIKENLTKTGTVAKTGKAVEEVIILEDSQDVPPVLAKTPNSVKTITKSKTKSKTTASPAEPKPTVSSASKLKIKFSLGSNKKRRKSARSAAKASDSEASDIEALAKELNPVKKVKIAEKEVTEDIVVLDDADIEEESPSTKKKVKKVDTPEKASSAKGKKAKKSISEVETQNVEEDEEEVATTRDTDVKESPNKKSKNETPKSAKSRNKKVLKTPTAVAAKTEKLKGAAEEVDDDEVVILDDDEESVDNSVSKNSEREKSKVETPKSVTKKSKNSKSTPAQKSKDVVEEQQDEVVVLDDEVEDKSNVKNSEKKKKPTFETPKSSSRISNFFTKATPKTADSTPTTSKSTKSSPNKKSSNEESTNLEKSQSVVEEKIDSTPKQTPVRGRGKKSLNPAESASTPKTSNPDVSPEVDMKKLTPSQAKKQDEKQRLKDERERKIQEEKLQRQKEKDEKELQKKKEREEKEDQKRREREEKEEQRRKEREEKEEQKRVEKDEKERKRLAEIEAKNEEKRKKDEAKEEERRKKEDDKRRKDEEEENKKKKAAAAFTKFFVQPKVSTSRQPDDDVNSVDSVESLQRLAFRPFQVKADMTLAPTVRRTLGQTARTVLEDVFDKPTKKDLSKTQLYVALIRSGKCTPIKLTPTVCKCDDDVIIVEDELEREGQRIDETRKTEEKYRAKYFLFKENRRPPYHGTWRKKSKLVRPRQPFALDKNFFDYDVDSDEEWEEEEPGESLNGSDDEKESEDDEYEVDNEWFVPHGHLSDEEMADEDEALQDNSREAQKAKLKFLQQEFAQEMKKKTERIKPRLIGTIWQDENGNRPDLCPTVIWDSLNKRAMLFTEAPLLTEPPKGDTNKTETGSPQPDKPKRLELTDELIKDLIHLIHGNRHKKIFLINEFLAFVGKKCEISDCEAQGPKKGTLREKIDSISMWSTLEGQGTKKDKKRRCWLVKPAVLTQYSLEDLDPNSKWTYTLEPKFHSDPEASETPNATDTEEKPPQKVTTKQPKVDKRKSTSEITKFTKVLSKDASFTAVATTEKKANLPPKSAAAATPDRKKTTPSRKSIPTASAASPAPTAKQPAASGAKKRVPLLMSVPRGQQIPQQSKNALISNFLKKDKSSSEIITSTITPKPSPMEVDGVITLD